MAGISPRQSRLGLLPGAVLRPVETSYSSRLKTEHNAMPTASSVKPDAVRREKSG